jgi:hypothetical protein
MLVQQVAEVAGVGGGRGQGQQHRTILAVRLLGDDAI